MREAHLRDLIAVIDTGSLRAASRQLGISQAAVSKNLLSLEKSLGVPLLVRNRHGVEPTEYGRTVLRRARAIEAEMRHLQQELDEMVGQRMGAVTVGLSATAESMLLSTALMRFRKSHPDVLVSVLGGRSASTISALREGRVDFVVGPPLTPEPPADLHFERLLSTDLVVVAREGHPLRRARQLAELVGTQWIVALRQPPQSSLLARAFERLGLPAPDIVAHSDSSSALVSLLLETDMLTVSSDGALQPYCRPGMLATIPIALDMPPVVQHLVTSAHRPLTPSAQALAAEFRKTSRRFRR